MDDFDRKTCPQCREAIHWQAKKCPHCLSPQGRQYLAYLPAMAAFIPALFFLIYFNFLNPFNKPHKLFQDYRSQVQIVSSEMHYSQESGKGTVSVIGNIKNSSPVIWNHVAIEVQCFNAQGQLIDTSSDQDPNLNLVPRTEQAFRVRFDADKPASEYVSFKAYIREAEDAHRFY